MKRILALFIAFVMLFTCACGASAKPKVEPTPEPTPVPTPEPTPARIVMSCAVADVLDADRQSFLSTIRSEPPVVVTLDMGDERPNAIVIDLDTVRSICSAITGLNVSAEVMTPDGSGERHISLTRKNSEVFTLDFIGNTLCSLDSYYEIADIDSFWSLLNDICDKFEAEAEENRLLMASEGFKTIEYSNPEQWKMNFTHSRVQPVGANDGAFQTIRTNLTISNTGSHLIMSIKLIAKYLNEDGYVVADVPIDLDFNSCAIFLGETRDYLLDQVVYNPNGEDSDLPAATEVMFTIVNVNAPDEAGH